MNLVVVVKKSFSLMLRDEAEEKQVGDTVWAVNPTVHNVAAGTYESTSEEDGVYYFQGFPAMTLKELETLAAEGFIAFQERSDE